MRQCATIVFILLLIGLAFGIAIPAIYRAREEQEFRRCQNNLRLIINTGLAHAGPPNQPVPETVNSYFPPGTLFNSSLPFDRRMSWYALILEATEREQENGSERGNDSIRALLKQIDTTKAWNASPNDNLARRRIIYSICPAQVPEQVDNAGPTNYLGNGGIGAATPELSIEAAGKSAGVFRYDTPTPLQTIRDGDGLSNTIAVGESAFQIGPWLQGGPPTIRGVEPNLPAYLGSGRPFAGCHRGRGNFAYADGSVHVITDSISPGVFRALLTIQGDERDLDLGPP